MNLHNLFKSLRVQWKRQLKTEMSIVISPGGVLECVVLLFQSKRLQSITK